MKNEQKPILSISLLVSNNIETIRKCMESIRPLLEQVPSELIVVDTVGEEDSDGSLAVAKEYADEVVRFVWCNDFAAARNAGLNRASGEWFMFLDDDEWFEDVTDIVEFFQSGEYKQYNHATYRIKDYRNFEGSYVMSTLHRMIRLEEGARFEGVVHECLVPLKPPCKMLMSYVHHYGYVFQTEEEHRAHSRRNLTLLRPEFEKNPGDLRLRLQMVQECMFLPELEKEALALCEGAFSLKKTEWLHPAFQWILAAYVRLAERGEDKSQVPERAKFIRTRFPLSALCTVALSTMELPVFISAEQYKEAVAGLKRFEKAWEYLQTHEKQREEQKTLDFEVFLEPALLARTMEKGIVALHHERNFREAEKWTKRRHEVLGQPMLSISLLVSNNKATVRKCMESLAPLLRRIPSELIVVDTVGEENSDGSLAIAREYADEVVSFSWCNDFAAARNAGLERTSGEWFLFLDDDEWFENIEEIVCFFEGGEYLGYKSATYRIRNYKDAEGKTYNEAALARMTKKGKMTQFVGTVHETFSELYLPCKNFEAYVHHYGYVYASEEERRAHRERNTTLLKKELEKNPMNLRFRSQMAQELASYDNENALRFLRETFAVCAEEKKENNFQWQLALVFRVHEALGTSFSEAEQEYRMLKEQFGFCETTEAAVCFQMVRIALIEDVPEQALSYAGRYFEALRYLEEHKDIQQLQMCGDSGNYLCHQSYVEMLHFAAYCAWKAKSYDTAWTWFCRMPWEENGYVNAEGFDFLWYLHQEAPRKEKLKEVIERIKSNPTAMKNEALARKMANMSKMLEKAGEGENAAMPDWIKSDIKLTIGILVSNNIATIRKCMDSLAPILQQVSSELIVVDTVGEENSDGSLAVAREYTDKVYRFVWCNDFAAARNVCFEHARGEWFLFVDDDEWFDDVAELIAFFNSGESDCYGHGLYKVRNYRLDGGYTEAIVGRFIHRTERTRFIGRVHEQFNEIYAPSKMFSVFAHHTGYVYRDEQELKKHQERNLNLMRKIFAEEGYTPHVCAQMAQELMQTEDTYEEAYRFILESIEALEKGNFMQDSRTQWVLVASARYFSVRNDYEGLLTRVRYLQKRYPLSEMAQLFLAALVTGAANGKKEYKMAVQAADGYLAAWDYLSTHPEQAMTQNQLDFNIFFNEETYHMILHIAGRCANAMEEYECANRYWKRLPWQQEGFEKARYWYDMQNTMEGLKKLQEQKKQSECLAECIVILNSMEEAEQYLRDTAETVQREELNGLLAGMQEAAIAVGTKLDAIFGEGTEEVSVLEVYCEEVWKCNESETPEQRVVCFERMRNLVAQVKTNLLGRQG